MRKTLYATQLLILISNTIFAQIGGIEDSVNDVSDTIRAIFPIILGVIFLIGFLFNAGHFFGENADLKMETPDIVYHPRRVKVTIAGRTKVTHPRRAKVDHL